MAYTVEEEAPDKIVPTMLFNLLENEGNTLFRQMLFHNPPVFIKASGKDLEASRSKDQQTTQEKS